MISKTEAKIKYGKISCECGVVLRINKAKGKANGDVTIKRK